MPMFTLPIHDKKTVVLKKAAKLSVATYDTNTELDATLAVWRTAVEASSAPRSRTLGMTSGATTTTYGYESTDDVVLNEVTFTALGDRTAVTTAALAEPTDENEALVYNLSTVATNGTGQVSRQTLDSTGVLPTFAFCRDYIGSGGVWKRAIFAQSNCGTDDASREEGVETNVTTLPLSIKATRREGYLLVEIINFGADTDGSEDDN